VDGGRPSPATGFHLHRDRAAGAEVRFAGKGPRLALPEAARLLLPAGRTPVWLRQVHGRTVLAARAGCAGEGDAVVSRDGRHALVVATADCVPVLLAGDGVIAAAHAGWRGIAAGVVAATVARMAVPGASIVAWIGPAIGPCCYEVGEDVAARVVAASAPDVARPGPRGRPHLDLPAAVARQLASAGVRRVRRLDDCTRCRPERWWSYRREGRGAGRNLALICRAAGGSEG